MAPQMQSLMPLRQMSSTVPRALPAGSPHVQYSFPGPLPVSFVCHVDTQAAFAHAHVSVLF
jgi:hypothetical protein